MKIINLISGPRNLSTALMYSFSQRPDTVVIDEPFYAHYLVTTGIDHPSREETINSMSSNINEILDSIFSKKKESFSSADPILIFLIYGFIWFKPSISSAVHINSIFFFLQ